MAGARLTWATPRRTAAAAALLLAVVALHAWLTRELAQRMADLSAAAAPMPQRLAVSYVREMQLAAPPAAPAAIVPAPAPKPRRRPKPTAARPPLAAASAIAQEAVPAGPAADDPAATAAAAPAADAAASSPQAAAPSPEAAVAEAAASATGTGATADAAEPGSEPFQWPPSTRVTYNLVGNYLGEVQGDAQVEWIKAGSRYQVNVDISVGPRFAPLATRRMSSEGELGPAQLRPGRYDEETRIVLREPRRLTMTFGDEMIVLANGERRQRVEGVQDTASQFIQMAVLFSLRPDLLQPGGVVETLLALPRSVDVWLYDVLAEETLATPFGPVATFHLKPRRARKAGELLAELWFAPALRYLPVRIRIEQDAQTYVDLMIARKPELGAP